ncbi:GNAT family acetyltransferase [Paenibacillus donghaensis]|uniref:GNAT family acetyltransferase n=1 Tax=Paenibacillus donghaensis TaxID=414771 RepID=A0A2Z2KH54_9BACL|nr:GNAT family N-acetyltransferase [Paenibacillus donghaensis]ASA21499.1 GNAT family acetyltransferase [Paenibacillus donghaensis]
MMQHGHYFKIILDDLIAGGAIIFVDQHKVHNVGRIYLDPGVHNQGYGTRAMRAIEQQFPDSRHWWLDTPAWSVRNHHFYKKCGYTQTKVADGQFIFEKTL